jgi:hypothetical protein
MVRGANSGVAMSRCVPTILSKFGDIGAKATTHQTRSIIAITTPNNETRSWENRPLESTLRQWEEALRVRRSWVRTWTPERAWL